ncbi:DUF4928 family protein [Dyadobacter sp. CY345]|uniref:DUF4928 family protein n=1 Tax=Dyadobacter sp. CY345 TaxID=2909335 RepID=UPI0038D47D1E
MTPSSGLSFAALDQENGRTGDFDIGDVTIHVTTRPSEALLYKCRENLLAAV